MRKREAARSRAEAAAVCWVLLAAGGGRRLLRTGDAHVEDPRPLELQNREVRHCKVPVHFVLGKWGRRREKR